MAKYRERIVLELCDFKHFGGCLGDCGIFKRYDTSGKVIEVVNGCLNHEALAVGKTTAFYEYPYECQNERT